MTFDAGTSTLLSLLACLILQAAFFAWKRWASASALLTPVLRAVLQLSLMAGVLQRVCESRNITLSAIFIGGMAIAGIQVVRSRSQVPRSEWFSGDGLDLAMVIFGLAAIASLFAMQASGAAESLARSAIPFVGLILGNTLSGLAVSLDHLRSALRSDRSRIESRLLLGASVHEAVTPQVASALRAGMGPILSSMSGAGLVSIPGAWSGQLLAGADPMDSVRIQLLVLGAICLSSGCACAALLNLWVRRRLVSERETLSAEVFA